MQTVFLKKNNSKNLNLIFLGYGQDELPFSYLKDLSLDDLLLAYDYTNLEFDGALLDSYSSINIIAWSMGVMLAPLIIKNLKLNSKVKFATAINGTCEGIDDRLGIPLKLWMGTIEALNEVSLVKFYRRMCSVQEINEYLEHKPERSVESLKEELIKIKELKEQAQGALLDYRLALIGNKDRIIAPVNQKTSWEQKQVLIIEEPCTHYDTKLFKMAFDYINNLNHEH